MAVKFTRPDGTQFAIVDARDVIDFGEVREERRPGAAGAIVPGGVLLTVAQGAKGAPKNVLVADAFDTVLSKLESAVGKLRGKPRRDGDGSPDGSSEANEENREAAAGDETDDAAAGLGGRRRRR